MSERYEIYRLRRDIRGMFASAPIEYHVAKSGNDSQSGKSLASAFLTPEQGIEALNNLTSNIRGAVLWVHPGFYYVKDGQELEKYHTRIRAVDPTPESTVFFFSGTSGELAAATLDGLTVKSGYNIMSGITMYVHKNTKAALVMTDHTSGADEGGFNIIDGCYFSPQAQDGMAYCLQNIGANRNIIRNCRFEGAATAGIDVYSNIGNPVGLIIENCDFIGTGIGINIRAANYNTMIRKNWFSAGVQSGENMTNAIVITSGMTAGKLTIMKNNFEQSDANDISDSKGGGTVLEMDNTNAA
jgi:hypothetical protein